MHVPGSRTARHLLKRWVTWPLTDAVHRLSELCAPKLQDRPRPRPSWIPTNPTGAFELTDWARIINRLSERSSSFFSDNLLSNESSYLHVADAFERVHKGLAYVGVGPEQNFSYVALLEPSLAFLVDCRRDNLTLHLLYKALFEEAATREQWLLLLLGSALECPPHPDDTDPIDVVLDRVERAPFSQATFAHAHARVRSRLERLSTLLSPPLDWRTLERFHQRFFRERLGITFQLHRPGRHTYPTLRSLLSERGSDGRQLGFLASSELYARVRRLQCEHRIVPLVGDFTGHRAFAGVAELLRWSGTPVGALYASNVEQMVWESRRWRHWIRNLGALPLDPSAILIRCYVDQGRSHPRQLSGHRTTTLVQPLGDFLQRERRCPYRDHWEVVAGEPTASAPRL